MHPDYSAPFDADYSGNVRVVSPAVGDCLEIFWPLDNQFYPATVPPVNDNYHCIDYENGDKKEPTQTNQTWYTLPGSLDLSKFQIVNSNAANSLCFLISLRPLTTSFLRQQAEGFEQYAVPKASNHQVEELCKQVRRIPVADIPADAEGIQSHVIKR